MPKYSQALVFREFSLPVKCVTPQPAQFGACRLFQAVMRLTACFLLLMQAHVSKAQSNSAEYRNKATFLTTFPSFIDWPDAAFSSIHAPLTVCVRGDFSFGTSLAEMARAEAPHGRHIEVRWMHRDQDLRACHIAFISRSESRRYAEILQSLGGGHVLTVGETPDFLDAGGTITFTLQRGTLHFEINLRAATDAQLRISSRLLALAVRVNQVEAAKN